MLERGLQCAGYVAERGAGKEVPVEGSVIKKMGCEFPLVSRNLLCSQPRSGLLFLQILVLQVALGNRQASWPCLLLRHPRY